MQGGRGGKVLGSRRQKVNHRKGNLRRRTDLSMDRETDAENGSALARMCPYTARPGGEPTEAPRRRRRRRRRRILFVFIGYCRGTQGARC